MSPAVNVELEEVPFAILETVKARILANRRRLGLSQQQGRPRPSTRPRAQFRKTGASSKGWRKPQHGAGALGSGPGVDIAVIDEDSDYVLFGSNAKQADWDIYTGNHPERTFVLIQPRLGTNQASIVLPAGFNEQGYRINVTRPGDQGGSTDWYSAIQAVTDISSSSNFRITVDNSGSMVTATVTPDLQDFILKLREVEGRSFYNSSGFIGTGERWIYPFIDDDIDQLMSLPAI